MVSKCPALPPGWRAARRRAALLGATALAAPVAFAVLLTSALPAVAQTWTGATSTDWFDGTNWSTGTAPITNDSPKIDTTTPNATFVDGFVTTFGGPATPSLSQVFIGYDATGQLTIQNGGQLAAVNGFVGTNAGSTGTVTVDCSCSSWTTTDASNGTIVGFNGTGTFNVLAGGAVTTANTILGFGVGSSGTVTVDASTWNQTGAAPLSALFVGYGGIGSFTVQNGGTVNAVDTYVGHLAGSNGTVTVTGAGSTWTGSGSVFVGNFGTGAFKVLSGATATSTLDTVLGYGTGSTGTITVNGAGSTWTTNGDIIVGGNGNAQPGGTGIFNVENGSTVNANRDTVLSASSGAVGTVTVTDANSQWIAANDVYIGGVNRGTFNVLNGGTVTVGGNTYLGVFSGGNGTLAVDGANSTWTNAAGNAIVVGGSNLSANGGTGTVNISNGGQVSSDFAFIGYNSGSTGTVTVSGLNSKWTMTGDSTIGGNDGFGSGGTGTFTVQNGASLQTDGTLYIGNSDNGTGHGTLIIDGVNGVTHSTWTANNILVGEEGTGAVNITNGGVANVGGTVILGDCFCATGTVTVSGAGSQFNATLGGAQNVVIGWDGTGTFKALNGATATVAGEVVVGQGQGSGTLSVESGATFSADQLTIGSNTATGTVTVSGTGSLLTSNTNTYIGAGSTADNKLSVLDGATGTLGNIVVGFFGGTGTLKVDATSQVNGTGYSQNATSTFNAGISPTGNGKVTITGNDINLDGALVVNAKTTQAKKYDIMTTDNGVVGTFSSVSVVGNANNLQINYAATCGAGLTCVELSVDTFSLANVLPPGTSGNAGNVAGALDKAIASGLTIPDAFFDVFALSGSSLVNALSQLSGEPAAGATQSNTQLMNSFLSLLLNPYGGAPGGNPAALSYAREFGAGGKAISPEAAQAYAAVTPKDKRVDPFGQRWGVWGQAYGGYNKNNGDTTTGSHDTTARTYGLATGFDYRASADTMVGFALAGGGTSWGLSDNLGTGRSDVLQLGLYGTKQFGAAYLSGALSYAWHSMSTDRTVTVSGSEHLTASFDAHSIGGRLETGYRIMTPFAGITPYAALQVQDFYTPSYSESVASGSNAFALAYDSRSTVVTRTELGAWLDKSMALDRGNVLALRTRAAWANDHSSKQGLGAAFQTLPGSNFTVNGATPATNLALLSAGAEVRLANNVSGGAKLDGEFSSHSQTYTGAGTVRYVW